MFRKHACRNENWEACPLPHLSRNESENEPLQKQRVPGLCSLCEKWECIRETQSSWKKGKVSLEKGLQCRIRKQWWLPVPHFQVCLCQVWCLCDEMQAETPLA